MFILVFDECCLNKHQTHQISIPKNAFEITFKSTDGNEVDIIIFNKLDPVLFHFGNLLFQSAKPFEDYMSDEEEKEYFNSFELNNGGMLFAVQKQKNEDDKITYKFAGMLTHKEMKKDVHGIGIVGENEKVGYISDCILDKSFQGKSIMNFLMELYLFQIQYCGFDKTYLRTLEQSNMAHLAPKCGFVKLDKTQTVETQTFGEDTPGELLKEKTTSIDIGKEKVPLYTKKQERIFFQKNIKKSQQSQMGMK